MAFITDEIYPYLSLKKHHLYQKQGKEYLEKSLNLRRPNFALACPLFTLLIFTKLEH